MITPAEIKDQCLKWWKDVLRTSVNGESYFPKEIPRIKKVNSKDVLTNLLQYRNSIEELIKHSKHQKGFGYKVHREERNFGKIGRNSIPTQIEIETLEDYLKLISKEKAFLKFISSATALISSIPKLKYWIQLYPEKVIEHDSWNDTLKVCHYFLQNPKPDLYIRQLPIEVHTKYIENNEALIKSLLEFLIPEHINKDEKKFQQRFNLKYDEPVIRIRFLDNSLSPIASTTDISMPLSAFNQYSCNAEKVVVAENIMNFLTLPDVAGTIAIWSGGGFNVSYFKDVLWLKTLQLFYWGDIDAHGFQILNQFRSYFPTTIALMMDEATFQKYWKPSDRKAPSATAVNLSNLTEIELNFYHFLNSDRVRLEQEKITQLYANQKIEEALGFHLKNCLKPNKSIVHLGLSKNYSLLLKA